MADNYLERKMRDYQDKKRGRSAHKDLEQMREDNDGER